MSEQPYLRLSHGSRPPDSGPSVPSLSQSSIDTKRKAVHIKDRVNGIALQSKAGSGSKELEPAWQPLFLSRRILCMFLLLFSSIILALEILQFLSNKNRGLVTSTSGKHYLWTYGPTAILVIIAALWRQVDYQARQLAPWARMARGFTPADRSMLLDYVSPLLIVSFKNSLRNCDFLVALTISEFILVKILVIISTGLLVLQGVPAKPTETNLRTSDKFDGSTFNAAGVDGGPALASLSIQSYGMPYPMFSNGRYATQSVGLPSTWSESASAVFNTTVDYFGADLKCDIATFHRPDSRSSFTCSSNFCSFTDIVVNSSSCHTMVPRVDVPLLPLSQLKPTGSISGWTGIMQRVACNMNATSTCWSNINGPSSQLMVLLAFSEANAGKNKAEIVNATALLCKPMYEVGRANLIMNRSTVYSEGVAVHPIIDTPSRDLEHVTPTDITTGFMKTLTAVAALEPADFHLSLPDGPGILDIFSSFVVAVNKSRPIWALTDPQTLIHDSQTVFRSITAQMARLSLMTDANSTIHGTYEGFNNRIVVRSLANRLMQGGCLILVIMTAFAIFITPYGVLPRSIDCLAGYMTIFSQSVNALEPFEGTGQKPASRLKQIAGYYAFRTTPVNSADGKPFHIEAKIDPASRRKLYGNSAAEVPSQKWWRPICFSMPLMIFTTISPLVIIVVVVSMFQASKTHNGLTAVDERERFRYIWTFGPAILLTGVTTLFNALDFEVETIFPYQTLRRGDSVEATIFTSFIGKTSAEALWDGVRAKQLAVIATAISVMFAPLLTIIVSGLFTVEKVPSSHSGVLKQVDWFTRPNSVNITGVSENVPEIVSLYNVPFPQWTYGGLVLPKIGLPIPYDSLMAEGLTSVTYISPALKGKMNCSSITANTSISRQQKIQAARPGLPGTSASTSVEFWLTGDAGCPGGADGNTSITLKFYPPEVGAYFGQVYSYDEAMSCGRKQLLVFGHITGTNLDQLDDFRMLACYPYLEQVMIDVTLRLSDLTIAKAPTVLQNTTKFLSDYYSVPENFPLTDLPDIDNFDGFTNYLVYGRDGIPASELLPSISRLLNATELLYEIYIAQLLNTDQFRTNYPADQQKSIDVIFTNNNRQRLIQHGLSTRLLEGILAILFACAVVAYTTIWRSTNGTRRVLPKNPCSIGSVASLLAGSDLLKTILPGTEYLTNRQMRERGIFKDYLFNLGWWDERQWFGIDIGKSDE